jgi:hypothetical protein
MGYRKTRSLVSSMEHLFTFSKMTFLGLLDELIRTGNMFAELRGDYNMFAGGQHPNVLNGAPERHTFICALAKGMGLLPEHTVPGAFFGMQQANRWDNLTRQALMKAKKSTGHDLSLADTFSPLLGVGATRVPTTEPWLRRWHGTRRGRRHQHGRPRARYSHRRAHLDTVSSTQPLLRTHQRLVFQTPSTSAASTNACERERI